MYIFKVRQFGSPCHPRSKTLLRGKLWDSSLHTSSFSLQQPGIGGEGEVHPVSVTLQIITPWGKDYYQEKGSVLSLWILCSECCWNYKKRHLHFPECFYIVCNVNKGLAWPLQQAERWRFGVWINVCDGWEARVGQVQEHQVSQSRGAGFQGLSKPPTSASCCSDTAPGCHISAHGASGQGDGLLDRAGGRHAGERLLVVHSWLPYQ